MLHTISKGKARRYSLNGPRSLDWSTRSARRSSKACSCTTKTTQEVPSRWWINFRRSCMLKTSKHLYNAVNHNVLLLHLPIYRHTFSNKSDHGPDLSIGIFCQGTSHLDGSKQINKRDTEMMASHAAVVNTSRRGAASRRYVRTHEPIASLLTPSEN